MEMLQAAPEKIKFSQTPKGTEGRRRPRPPGLDSDGQSQIHSPHAGQEARLTQPGSHRRPG